MANLPVTHGPAYLSLDPSERWLSGSHYGPGMMSVWRIADGRCTGEAVVTRKVDKHAHSSVFSPDGRFLVVPTTLPNRVYQFRFDATTGNATPNDPPFADGPAASNEARQPWHLIFHPTLPIAYTSNEREHPGIGVWRWDAATGQLNLLQQVVSTRPGFTGVITTADLHLTPDGRFLYLSNRDVTDRKATSGTNDLVSFRVDAETGHLTLIAHTPCEHVPRSFAISPTGAWLCVAGTGDGQLGLYRIDPDSGALTRLTQAKLPGRPSWVSIVNW